MLFRMVGLFRGFLKKIQLKHIFPLTKPNTISRICWVCFFIYHSKTVIMYVSLLLDLLFLFAP